RSWARHRLRTTSIRRGQRGASASTAWARRYRPARRAAEVLLAGTWSCSSDARRADIRSPALTRSAIWVTLPGATFRSDTLTLMRERSLEFKVGFLILVASAILVGLIFLLGNFSLRSGFTIQLDFDY